MEMPRFRPVRLTPNGPRHRVRAISSLLEFFLGFAVLGAQPSFKLPDGFSMTRVAGPPEVVFPMFATRGDGRVLFVAESSGLDLYAELQNQTRRCRISRLEDRDGDGVFEGGKVFVDQLVFPMGLVWREGRLYVADPPDLVVLEDTDQDGRADKRTVLLAGFGHTDNGSLHGLTLGPDGWLYLTLGQPDGYKLKRADGTFLEGKSGALLRCRPDGSDVEVVARGFENLVEVEFMPTGEIIGTDNWFSRPQAGQRDALVHLLEGAVYPLNAHAQIESRAFNSGGLLPPIALYPAVALSGIARYRGGQFPSRFRDLLFTAQFNARKVVSHRLQRSGSTFRSEEEDFLTTDDPDFHPSDVLEDGDGSLLVVDTGAWYVHHCPTGRIRRAPAQGGIFRVRSNQGGDPKPADRRRGENPPDTKTSKGTPVESDGGASTLSVGDPDVVARAARAIGRRGDKSAEKELIGLLSRPEAHVRLAAAEALVRCGSSNATPALIHALTAEVDPFLEHALLFALHALADPQTLSVALQHSDPRVQRAALILLDQAPHRSLGADAVLSRAVAKDASLRSAAQKILQQHAEWAADALPLVRSAIRQGTGNGVGVEALRELIRVFQHEPAIQSLVAEAVADANLPARWRASLVETLGSTTVAPLPPVWVSALEHLLRDVDPEISLQAARAVEVRRVAGLDDLLAGLAANTNLAPELRLTALRITLARTPELTPITFNLLLSQLDPRSLPGARLAAAEMLGRARWADPENDPVRLLALVRNDPLISCSTLLPVLMQGRGKGFDAAWTYLAEAMGRGWQPVEKEIQMIEKRVPSRATEEFARLKSRIAERAKTQRAEVETYAELLTGGDANRGREWFSRKAGCIACHHAEGQGGSLGPDLSKIGAVRSGRDLIESIVVPSASFAQGYETYSVTLRDGEQRTGIRVRGPDDNFTIRDASNAEVRLDPGQVQSIERLQTSLMPDGLLVALAREEIRDLLAYLQSLR
jgi:putative membrane-bound dehydrogenase-like protein